eukprot:SAG31_NODE_507_length_14746_cov_5.682119_3_plen_543_part_00
MDQRDLPRTTAATPKGSRQTQWRQRVAESGSKSRLAQEKEFCKIAEQLVKQIGRLCTFVEKYDGPGWVRQHLDLQHALERLDVAIGQQQRAKPKRSLETATAGRQKVLKVAVATNQLPDVAQFLGGENEPPDAEIAATADPRSSDVGTRQCGLRHNFVRSGALPAEDNFVKWAASLRFRFEATHIGSELTETAFQTGPAGGSLQEIQLLATGSTTPLVRLSITQHRSMDVSSGSKSFDQQYKELLRSILQNGKPGAGRRGAYMEKFGQSKIEVTLRGQDDEMLVPISCLRKVWFHGARCELLWYFRGEDNIKWLQEQGVKFWDADADECGFVGMNYGLLTNAGIDRSGRRCNPLMENIIAPLCDGKLDSRNMVVPLIKADANSQINSCTKCIQIMSTGPIAGTDRTGLAILVDQRSSDVVVGLPYDVVVWSIFLHLICREVWRRSDSRVRLSADKIIFMFGSAHVYDANREAAEILLGRVNKFETEPRLEIDNENSLAAIWQRPGVDSWKPSDLTLVGYEDRILNSHGGRELTKEMLSMQAR